MNAFQFLLVIIGIIGGIISLINALRRRHKMAMQISSVLMILVGIVVIVGHLVKDKKIYQIPSDQIGMSLLTATCFVITGALFLLISFHINFKTKN